MATNYSSDWLGTSNQYIQYQVRVADQGEDVVNNKSTIDVTIYMRRTNTGYTTYRYWGFTAVIDGMTYSALPGPYTAVTSSEVAIYSWSNISIPHNPDGSKTLGITVSMNATYPGSTTYTAGPADLYFGLPSIARKSTVSCPTSATMEIPLTISIGIANTSFTHRLTYSFEGASGPIDNGIQSSPYSWRPPISLAKQIPNSHTGKCKIYCETFNGSTSLGTTETDEFDLAVPDTVKLSVLDGWVTLSPYSDISSVVNSWEDVYVKNYSGIKATFNQDYISNQDSYDSKAEAFRLECGSSVVTSYPHKLPAFTAAGNVDVKATVIDSRGHETTITVPITIAEYTAPSFYEKHLDRCQVDGTLSQNGLYIRAFANVSFKDCGGHNAITIKANYKPVSGSYNPATEISLTNKTALVMGGGLIQQTASYVARITVIDTVGNSPPAFEFVIPTAEVCLNFRPGGMGACFGGYAEADNLLKVDWDMDVSGRIKTTALELGPASAAGHGGYIDFHYNGDSGDNTGRIIQPSPGYIDVQSELQVYGVTQPRLVMNDGIYYGDGGYAWFKLFTFKPSSIWDGAVVRVRGYSETANIDGRGHWEIILCGAAYSADVGLHNRGDLLFSTSSTPLSQFSYRFDSNSLYSFYFNAPQYTVYRILAEIFGPYESFTAHHQVLETPSGTSINIFGPY